MRLKYLMLTQIGTLLKVPVLFPEFLQHDAIATSGDYTITSAGFAIIFQLTAGTRVDVDGKSISLGLHSHPGDAKVIAAWLEFGLSGALGEQNGLDVRAMVEGSDAVQAAAIRALYPMPHRPVSRLRQTREIADYILTDVCSAVVVDRRRVISAEESRGQG